MKGAALADLHLGFTAYQHKTEGRNTRQVDTEKAWFAAVDLIVENQPDLVTIAGDIFHHPRVVDYAKRAFLRGLGSLLAGTDATIIVAQGNHDAGRTVDVLTPIALAEFERVHIVTEPKRIRLDLATPCTQPGPVGRKVSVACFPFVVGGDGTAYKLDPDPAADVNVLLMHAAVKGSSEGDRLPFFYGSSNQSLDIGREADRWDVLACGDFHEFTRLHPTRLAFYSGSLERTSSNIWAEHAAKGVVLYDTDTGEMELAEVPTREMYTDDLDPDPEPMSAFEVNLQLERMAEDGHYTDALVRLKVEDFPRAEREHIDWGLVRKLKSSCTHFYLDIRYAKTETTDLGDRRDRTAMTLADEALAFFKEDPEEIRDCAIGFLDLAAEVEDAEEVVS